MYIGNERAQKRDRQRERDTQTFHHPPHNRTHMTCEIPNSNHKHSKRESRIVGVAVLEAASCKVANVRNILAGQKNKSLCSVSGTASTSLGFSFSPNVKNKISDMRVERHRKNWSRTLFFRLFVIRSVGIKYFLHNAFSDDCQFLQFFCKNVFN